MDSNPWIYIIGFSIILVMGILLVGVLFCLVIAKAATRHSDKLHTVYIKEMTDLLPGLNCGHCGFESCEAYSDAVLHTQAPEDACPYAKANTAKELENCRMRLQKLLEDPTPPKEKKAHFWERKF